MRKDYYINEIEKIASKVPMNPNDNFGPFIDVDFSETSNKAVKNKIKNSKGRPIDTDYFDLKNNKKIKGDKVKNKFKYLAEDLSDFAKNQKGNFKAKINNSNVRSKIKNNAKHLSSKYPNALGYGIGAASLGLAAKSIRDNNNRLRKLRSEDSDVNDMVRNNLRFIPRKYSALKPNAIQNGSLVLRDPIPGTLTRNGKKEESKKYKKEKRKQVASNRTEMIKSKMKYGMPTAAIGAVGSGLFANQYKNFLKGVIETDNAKAGKYIQKALRDKKLSKQLFKAMPTAAMASGTALYMNNKRLEGEQTFKYLNSLSPEQRGILKEKYKHLEKKKK